MSHLKPTDHEATIYAENFALYGNQTRAFHQAFPDSKAKPEAIHVSACRFHQLSKVQLRCEEMTAVLAKQAAKDFRVDAAYVMQRIVEIDQMDVADIIDVTGNILPISSWPTIWRRYINSFEIMETGDKRKTLSVLKKIKWPDKIRNLEMMGKLTAVSAFTERKEITGMIEIKSTLTEDQALSLLKKHGLK